MSALAFDLGASSGRAIIGRLQDGRMTMEEVHRFSNDPVQVGDFLYWDILRLYHDVKQGIIKSRLKEKIESIGIDSWAVDFGLIGKNGELLGNPYHYRDHQTDGIMEKVFAIVPKEEIFKRTGIQFLQFNTIYQLAALRSRAPELLERAQRLLMIPDLLRYFLTGVMENEATNASSTQLLDWPNGAWDRELLEKLGIPAHLFADPVQPGTPIGRLREAVRTECGVSDTPVIAVAEHDTASAVAAVPAAAGEFAYLICGTWSLLGTELAQPVVDAQALAWNFTNEGGIGGTSRFLKNIMGLWLLQECRSQWEREGVKREFSELVQAAAEEKAFVSLIDPDDGRFLNPSHMPGQIQQYCQSSGQPVPQSQGQIVRCIIESLALKYRMVLERTEMLCGRRFDGLHMVGGGIQNTLLAQFTANSIGRPVWAGPVEASAIGNLVVQWMAMGKIKDIAEARGIIRASFPLRVFEPQDQAAWNEAYGRFQNLLN